MKKNYHNNGKITRSDLATEHPKVPAPKRRNFADLIFSRSISGSKFHFINFKFRSTAFSVILKTYKPKIISFFKYKL